MHVCLLLCFISKTTCQILMEFQTGVCMKSSQAAMIFIHITMKNSYPTNLILIWNGKYILYITWVQIERYIIKNRSYKNMHII
jgi:hypothetical protein